VDRLGHPERAAVGHAAGRLVGVDAVHLGEGGLDVVGAGADREQAGRELGRVGGGVGTAVTTLFVQAATPLTVLLSATPTITPMMSRLSLPPRKTLSAPSAPRFPLPNQRREGTQGISSPATVHTNQSTSTAFPGFGLLPALLWSCL
jgi:hypothetical protein